MRFCSHHREQRLSPSHTVRKRRTLLTTHGEEVRCLPRVRSRLVFNHRYISAGHGTKKRRAHLGDQHLPAVSLAPENRDIFFTVVPEPDRLGGPRSIQPGGVPGPVRQLGEKGRVISLGRGEQVQRRHGDPVAARVVGRLARTDQGTVAGDKIRYALPGRRCRVAGLKGPLAPFTFIPHTPRI